MIQKTMSKNDNIIRGFKGFDKDLKCRDFQYEVGKEYEHKGEVSVCNSGFHFCENPLKVFEYYAPSCSRYCEVEGDENVDKANDDSKVATSHIHISAEIGLNGLIKAGVKFILDKVNFKDAKATNTGDCSAATNTGNYSAATNTGNYSAATNTGDCSAATNTGDYSAATNTGNYSAATNTGDYSAATNTGNQSAATVEGNGSIAIVTGKYSKARGALGCWIVLTERGDFDGVTCPIKEVKAFKVDGVNIKENTFYRLVDGKPARLSNNSL